MSIKEQIPGSREMNRAAITHAWMIRTALLICGIVSALLWSGTDMLASLRYEGYHYPFQPISGLSAVEAPTRNMVVTLNNVFAVLKMAFASGVWLSAGQRRVLRITAGLLFASGVIDLAAYFFPWNPAEAMITFTNLMHGILAGGAAVLLILLTIGFGASAGGKWFRTYSYGTLLVFLVAGGVMAFLGGTPRLEANLPPPWFGITERIAGYGFMLWMMALASVLLRNQTESLRGELSYAGDHY
jgi:hypothetical protein